MIVIVLVATSCADKDFHNINTPDADGSAIEFAAMPEGWNGIGGDDASRASVVSNGNFLRFRTTAIVEDKTSHAKSLLMKYQLVEYSGGKWSYSPTKYWPSLSQYTTSFYAYGGTFKSISTLASDSPWEKATVVIPVSPEEQKDFLVARYTASDGNKVQMNFEHALTAVKIKTVNVKRPILSIEISGVYDAGDFNFHTWKWEKQRNSTWIGGKDYFKEFKYTFIGSELEGNSNSSGTYIKDANSSEIYLMMIPQDLSASGRNASIRVLFDNGTVIEQKLTQNWEKGKTVTYVIDYESNASCQWLDDSNCYLINPVAENNNTSKNIFAIPISSRINTFWKNEASTTPLTSGTDYVAEVIWQDSSSRQIYFTDNTGTPETDTYSARVASDNEHIYFKLANAAFSGTANVVVGVRLASQNTYLWSWHLWLTDYYPTPSASRIYNSACRIGVQNGTIERYEDPTNNPSAVWSGSSLSGRYIMDRNLGSPKAPKCDGSGYTDNDFYSTFGMYYQYGRKDPFPPNCTIYTIDGSVLGTITEDDVSLITGTLSGESVSVVDMVKYPMQFVTSNSTGVYRLGANWNNPRWWDASKHSGKSFYDPCPPGWQIPPQGIFNIFSPNHKYTSTAFYTGTVDTENHTILKIDDNVIGLRLGANANNSLKTDMLRWGVRWGDTGKWTTQYKFNSFLWYNSNYKIFNYIYNYFDLSTGTIPNPDEYLLDLNKTVQYGFHGAPIRAIHK